jgi:predicted ATP-grasp superfamily ATP-dependent carboligase
VLTATFSNISAISWRPVLVVKEAGVPGDFDLLIPNGPSLCISPDFNPISSLSVDLHTGKTISALMTSFYVDWSKRN